ncbi:hypothetical protein KR067_005406 [Drosophila pandora]|nr:hypothetical protein KR067_005406 [Drosophila pandora]
MEEIKATLQKFDESLKTLLDQVVAVKEDIRKVGTRVATLEQDHERRNPAVIQPVPLVRPRTEYELKETSTLPDCVKELQTYEGEPGKFVSWINWALDNLRSYLYGAGSIKVYTDHQPLTFALGNRNFNAKLKRWKSRIEEYGCTLLYKPAARIYKYDAPVVPLQQGGVWRINGMFKLVHVIDISRMMQLVDETSRDAATLTDQRINTITRHYLEQAAEGMNRVMRPTSRRARAVNWLGSAWKWIAGSPDAEDWNAVLNSEKMITENINQQIRINARLFDASHKSIQELNDVQLSWLTCQLAKTGVTNSNLLDHEEIETILTEVNDLPYQNAVEAVEFSRPTVLSNGTTLLYILALPKVSNRRYELVRLYPTVSGGRQIVLEHQKLALNGEETYAVVGSCSSIGNITVCPEEDLIALEENSCIPRLLKGGHASCSYLRSNKEVVQLVEDGTLFLSNYNGSLATPEREYQLEGTYIVQFNNEVVIVRNKNFTAYSANHPMALPPVLTNITVTGYRPSLGYVDDVNAQNTQVMSGVSRGVTFSYVLEASLTLIVFLILFIIWRELISTEGIPTTRV